MRELLILVNVLLALSLLIWPLLILLGSFLSGAPGALRDPFNLLVIALMWGYPIPVLYGNVYFWTILRNGSRKAQINCTLLGCTGPLALLLVALLIFIFG